MPTHIPCLPSPPLPLLQLLERRLPPRGALEEAEREVSELRGAAAATRALLAKLRQDARRYADADYWEYTAPLDSALGVLAAAADVLRLQSLPHLAALAEANAALAATGAAPPRARAQALQRWSETVAALGDLSLPSLALEEPVVWRHPPSGYIYSRPKGAAGRVLPAAVLPGVPPPAPPPLREKQLLGGAAAVMPGSGLLQRSTGSSWGEGVAPAPPAASPFD